MTYIPKQTKLAKERVEAKLDVRLVETLGRYCEYLDSDRDYVIGQALEIAFRKDKGFADWLESCRAVLASAQVADKPSSSRKTSNGGTVAETMAKDRVV